MPLPEKDVPEGPLYKKTPFLFKLKLKLKFNRILLV
jgi:hypothetical protein